MGFFDFLFSSGKPTNLEVVADKIWKSTAAKYNGIGREVEQRSKSESVAILLVAHFSDVLACLDDLAKQQAGQVPVMAVLASDLSVEIASRLKLAESETIDVIVAERHPLVSIDAQLEKFAAELPCRCRLSHHLSLEDPVLSPFAGEWVRNLLEQLGMNEDEAIESRMVTRRIKHAQEQIELKSRGHLAAESSAVWLEKNCPGFFDAD